MSEQQDSQTVEEVSDEASPDTKADVWAILIIFTTAVVLAMHSISGFTFDF